MPRSITDRDVIDRAAAGLRAGSRAFTRGNLYFAVRRARAGRSLDFASFCAGPLAARLRAGPLPGLLPPPAPPPRRRLPPEWDAYFPAAILLVDRPAIVDLIAASGALVQGRVAPVALDGTPGHVVRWLRRGFAAGRRAPVAYLHDATTLVYPFLCEPLATLVEATRGEPLPYRDLGLPPRGLPGGRFLFAPAALAEEPIVELEQLPPAALVAYAVRGALALVPPDPLLAPLCPGPSDKRRRRSKP
jgi:hypothetical protein